MSLFVLCIFALLFVSVHIDAYCGGVVREECGRGAKVVGGTGRDRVQVSSR